MSGLEEHGLEAFDTIKGFGAKTPQEVEKSRRTETSHPKEIEGGPRHEQELDISGEAPPLCVIGWRGGGGG